MSYLEFKERFNSGELCVGVDVLKALRIGKSLPLPWRILLETRRFQELALLNVAVLIAAPFLGVLQNVFLLGGTVGLDILIDFLIIAETLFNEAVLDACFFDWAVRNRIIVLVQADDRHS
jgi:hypothetical protein